MNTKSCIGLLLVVGAQAAADSAAAEARAAIINVAGCASITWASKGYALLNQFYEMSGGVENDGVATAVLLCAAELPPGATAFDYAEFEYTPGSNYLSPWLVVLQVWRVPTPGGGIESWIEEVGQCGKEPPAGNGFGPFLPTSPMTLPMNICQTQGDLDLTALAAVAPAAEVSFVYLVVLPGWSSELDGWLSGWAQAFRIVTYYEQ